jgi:hypothetical protein
MATGWDNGLCQDYHRGLGKWFADRLGARYQLKLNLEKKTMKTIKVSEATNIQLDWLVTHIEGIKTYGIKDWLEQRRYTHGVKFCTDWAHGGPIIEREKIELVPSIDGKVWYAESLDRKARIERCPTPLIAAMRCFVTSKLGDEIEVPDELN